MAPSFWRVILPLSGLLSTALVSTQRVDLTVEPGTRGEDVVWAVLSKVDLAGIFAGNDADLAGIFMRRLAYVETQDGMQFNSSSTDSEGGGIWRVSQEMFMQTQTFSYSSVDLVYQMIHTHFGFDWKTDVIYSNLSKPLISGLAVRIYLDYLEKSVRQLVPPQNRQASYWSTYFHVGASITIWENAISELNIKEECTVDTDVMMVLDSSGSIGSTNYQRVREFTHDFADALFQHSGRDRMGIVLFGNKAVVEKGLDSEMNKTELLRFIDTLPYFSQSTSTADGLCKLLTQPWRREELVLKLAIVLTDGKSNTNSDECGNITQAAMQVHSLDPPILVDAIGVGSEAVKYELDLIATDTDHVYTLDTYDTELTRTQEEQAYKFCWIVSQPLPVGHLSNGSSGQGEKTRLSLSVALEEDITLRLCVLKGRIVAYASTTVQNPSSALYDWKAEVAAATLLTINCFTSFFAFESSAGSTSMTPSTTSATPSAINRNENTLYVSVEGLDETNEFIVNSTIGNETLDVNECAEDPVPCGPDSTCHNTDGSYYCVCNEGYRRGDDGNCIDIDECSELEPCDKNAQCENTIGGYTCECINGYAGDGILCTDMIECEHVSHNPCHEHAQCTNTIGGHYCTCLKGYTGNGLSCSKVGIDVSTYVIIGVGGGGGLVVILVILIGVASLINKKRRKTVRVHYSQDSHDQIALMNAENHTDI